ncbi:Fez family zinc finger protein 1, partial [Nibea albiflora]
MSRGDALRGFVTDRLAAASREILAVVDRVVAGYEEEASGFRREIDRQRRQLEVLLQPRVTLTRTGVKRGRSLGLDEEGEEDEDGDEDEDEDGTPEPSENLEESTNQTPPRGQCKKKKKKPGRPHISEPQNQVDLRIRFLEDVQTDVVSNSILKKCPALKLKCCRDLPEPDFVDLLKSTFSQLCGDNKPFDILTSDRRRRLQPLKVKTLTPAEIHRSISSLGGATSTLYIRLKVTHKQPPDSEDETPQTKDNNAALSASADERHQARKVKLAELVLCPGSSTSQPQDVETGDTHEPTEDLVACSTAESKADGETNDWKQDKSELKESESELQSKTTKKQKRHSGVRTAETKPENSDNVFSCKACGALHESEVLLFKHVWSHTDDPGDLCGVCGDVSESAEALKDHLLSQHKTADCHICGESFLDVLSLNEHVAAHSGERPHQCDVCHEAFALKESLENHQKLHKADKVHSCYTCH